jgi:hypothetical protein
VSGRKSRRLESVRSLGPIFQRHGQIPVCSLTYAEGGNYASCVVDRLRRPSGDDVRDWVRGDIGDFSPGARGRLLRLLNSVNREAVPCERVWFGTLTYPCSWTREPQEWKSHLKAFVKRFERKWGRQPVVHKLEFQKRGAPHFHLLLIWVTGPPDIREFREWQARAWAEIVAGQGNEPDVDHLKAGTQADPARSWGGVNSYVGKYMSKEVSEVPVDPATGEVKKVGRFWGVHRRELLPITIVKEDLTIKQACAVRRALCRLKGKRVFGKMQSVNAYVLSATCERLLDWVRREKWAPSELEPGGERRFCLLGSVGEAQELAARRRVANDDRNSRVCLYSQQVEVALQTGPRVHGREYALAGPASNQTGPVGLFEAGL